ncbi:hypothetical protein OH76DRAFT_1407290 [Lentinus brumalis]|uniref:Hemopexin n=1 Tax=Lentinus brumalis TaxID=2498619 RepID=A0A371D0T8_9APHY|nr:hypothetical protein OH76DRAFT_1407290 [Polyporus brumalis]
MYFFCLEKYVRIDITPGADDDDIFDGPRVIVDAWPSLKKAEFKTIDAVLTSPANNDEAYFFSGERYVRVKLNLGTNNDYIVDGPTQIVDGWASLKDAGFKTVDTILPNPSNLEEAYFFSGERYVRIKVNPGGVDTIISGPWGVEGGWPSLKKAAFW